MTSPRNDDLLPTLGDGVVVNLTMRNMAAGIALLALSLPSAVLAWPEEAV